MKQLFPAQVVAKDFLLAALRSCGSALDSSDVGTGKTLKAVRIAAELGEKPVVVCPKSVIPGWTRAFDEQRVDYRHVVNYEKIKGGRHEVVSKSGKSSYKWNLPKGSLIVFDECHACKGLTTKNAYLLLAAKAQGMRVLMLSATPFEDPTEMKAIGYACGLHNGQDFFKWAQLNGCGLNMWKALVFDPCEIDKLDAINRRLYSTVAHKLTRSDLGNHFAQCSIDWTPLDFDDKGEIARALAEVEGPLKALAERASLDGEDAIALVQILRARQKVELCKVPLIATMVKDSLAAGLSVFVALNFNDSIDALMSLIPAPAVTIRGGQSAAQRQAAIDAFQDNSATLCVANVAAGGVGINLHDEHGGHPRIAYISPSYDAKALMQVLGRTDRVGAQSDVIQRVLTAAGTIEETVLNSLQQKISNISLLNAQAGVDTVQTIIETRKQVNQIIPTAEDKPAHARFSPSALKYYKSCPGFLPTGGDNEASLMGTRIHYALETDDDTDLRDERERYIAYQCRAAVQQIQRVHRMQTAEDIREIKVDITAFSESTFGTCDRLFIDGSRAVAIDYKTGRGGIDDAEQNMQSKAYVLGMFQRFPSLQTIDFYFIIPQREELLHAKFTRAQENLIAREIEKILQDAKKVHACWDAGNIPVDMLKIDESICRYCKRLENNACPRMYGVAMEVVRRYAPEITLPDNTHASSHTDPEVVAGMLKLVPMLEKWAEGVKHQAKFLAFEKGMTLPGFEIKTRAGTRTITDPTVAWKCVEPLGVDMNEFLTSVGSVSVSAYEKLISNTAKRGEKAKAISEVMATLYANGGIKQGEDSHILAAVK